MKNQVIWTNQLPEQISSLFYIVKDNDASTVLFDTMGGYRFVSLSERDREWQAPLAFKTIEEAQAKLKELHNERKEVTLKFRLQVVKITHTEAVTHQFYRTYHSESQHKDERMINLFESFEQFYAGHSTGYTEAQLISIRKNEYNDVGYTNSTVHEAFKRYVELVESLPA